MDLDAIAVFVKVVETGGFSAAARALDMPKTTVSAKVAALEKRLGTRLIERTTRKLRVTEAGDTYFRHCANAVREVELGEAALQSAREHPTGLLKVTAPVDIGHAILPAIARAYVEQYPETRVELVITNRTVDLVGEGMDLAIRTAMKDSSLVARRFFDMQMCLWATPRYLKQFGPISHPRQLGKARFVCFSPTKSITLVSGKTEITIPGTGRLLADDLETVKSLALLDEGIASLPDFLVADAVKARTLVQVLPQWRLKSATAFYFVHAGQRYASPKVQAFMELAIQLHGRT